MNNNELSDFIKLAYKYGKVKKIEEAFKEFPVEEEWHQGKKENLLKEILNEQINFKIGKVDLKNIEEYKRSYKDNIEIND